MPAEPFKYYTADSEPGNLTTGAHLPGASASGLTDGELYSVQNTSPVNTVYYEERESGAAAGTGKLLRPEKHLNYEVNAESPLFVWTLNEQVVVLSIGKAPG